jgi:hypothetical protein
MADTGEDREIKQRANAHQKEVVQEMNKLEQKAKERSVKNTMRTRSTSHPKTKLQVARDSHGAA